VITAGDRQITRNRFDQPLTQPVSSPKRVSVTCQSAKTVDTVVKNAHFGVAFLGEMDDGDQQWLAKVDLEAVETRTLTEVKF